MDDCRRPVRVPRTCIYQPPDKSLSALFLYIVARRARRSGIGTELLRHSLDQAREFGFSAMMFNLVLESNPSRRLYEAAGFTVVGRIPEARGNEPGLIYWRHL